MADTADLLKPGQLFAGRYRVQRFLAHGGHGAVYVAEDTTTKRAVAIKVLLPQVLAADEVRASKIKDQFAFEATVAGRVNSEYIVDVRDAGVDEETGVPFIVMEFLEGRSLAEHIKQFGPLKPLTVAIYLRQVAHGLEKAHRYLEDGKPQPIIHRDLKPQNLFLGTREDGSPIVKILDFGIAKVLSDDASMTYTMGGTPLYMAYEQAMGEPVTPATDVWALGLVAFYLLSGKPYWLTVPTQGMETGPKSVIGQLLKEPIVSATARAREQGVEPNWPAEFDGWFLKCVNRDPSARYPSAQKAALGLCQALLGDSWEGALRQAGASLETIPPPSSGLFPGGDTLSSGDITARSVVDPGRTVADSALSVATTAAPRAPSTARSKLIGVAALLLVLGGLFYARGRSSPGAEDAPETASSVLSASDSAAAAGPTDGPPRPEPAAPSQPKPAAAPSGSIEPPTAQAPGASTAARPAPASPGVRPIPKPALAPRPARPAAPGSTPATEPPERAAAPAPSSRVWTER